MRKLGEPENGMVDRMCREDRFDGARQGLS